MAHALTALNARENGTTRVPTGCTLVRMGTFRAVVRTDKVATFNLLIERASQVPTLRAARAKALRGGIGRRYPKFKAGMSPRDYVEAYYQANSLTGLTRNAETVHQGVKDFFEPLSTLPMFSPPGEVLEEVLEEVHA